MMFLREDERFWQWGRQVTGKSDEGDLGGFGVRTGSARGNAMAIGSVATVAAVLLPVLIPTLNLSLFGNGDGPGSGDDLTIVNPMTDLRRDLKQGEDIDLVSLTTDQVAPHHLRFAVLSNFNGQEWTTGNRSIPDNQTANGRGPAAATRRRLQHGPHRIHRVLPDHRRLRVALAAGPRPRGRSRCSRDLEVRRRPRWTSCPATTTPRAA